jgi:SOS response regulatory protein OraA/RecX
MKSSGMGKQITARVPQAVKKAFDTYAAQHWLDDSELAKLLILRERGNKQLALLRSSVQFSRTKGVSELPTITAHFTSSDPVREFDRYAKSCRLSRSSAAAWLIEKELSEQWLDTALSLPPAIAP